MHILKELYFSTYGLIIDVYLIKVKLPIFFFFYLHKTSYVLKLKKLIGINRAVAYSQVCYYCLPVYEVCWFICELFLS